MRHGDYALGRALAVLVFLYFSPEAPTQPSVVSPDDVARENQLHNVSPDFSGSPYYQLDTPIELYVRLYQLHTPPHGYATIVYSVIGLGEGAENFQFDPKRKYVATLQTPEMLDGLSLKKSKFTSGADAVLLGWPATERNQTPGQFLVDELEFTATGERFFFEIGLAGATKHPKAQGPTDQF